MVLQQQPDREDGETKRLYFTDEHITYRCYPTYMTVTFLQGFYYFFALTVLTFQQKNS